MLVTKKRRVHKYLEVESFNILSLSEKYFYGRINVQHVLILLNKAFHTVRTSCYEVFKISVLIHRTSFKNVYFVRQYGCS